MCQQLLLWLTWKKTHYEHISVTAVKTKDVWCQGNQKCDRNVITDRRKVFRFDPQSIPLEENSISYSIHFQDSFSSEVSTFWVDAKQMERKRTQESMMKMKWRWRCYRWATIEAANLLQPFVIQDRFTPQSKRRDYFPSSTIPEFLPTKDRLTAKISSVLKFHKREESSKRKGLERLQEIRNVPTCLAWGRHHVARHWATRGHVMTT